MKTYLLLTILVVCFSYSINTNAQTIFQKTFGGTDNDEGYSVQQTTDGGFIITGYTWSSGTGWADVYLVKTDVSGNTLWTKTFGGSNNDYGNSVQQTSDGGYIITGHTQSFGAGLSDVYLIKTNSSGNSLWTNTFGGTDDDFGYSIQQTIDGGYIITGSTGNFGAEDVYLIKTDALGDTMWTKTYGGSNNDNGNSVQQTVDNGYIFTGNTQSFGAGQRDVYLVKTDVNGDTLWTKTYGGTSFDESLSVQQTADGGYIITGNTQSFGTGGVDVYLVKTNANGDTLWTKTYGGISNDFGRSVQQTTDGGYIITGNTQSFGAGFDDVYLIKTDVNGDTLWTKTFGGTGTDRGYSVQQTTDGGYIITGITNSFRAGQSDVYLIKTDANGSTGINQSFSINNQLKIYPNPNTGEFIIEYGGALKNTSIILYNKLGQKVFESELETNRKTIDISELPNGLYILQLQNDNGYYYHKVVKY